MHRLKFSDDNETNKFTETVPGCRISFFYLKKKLLCNCFVLIREFEFENKKKKFYKELTHQQ